MNLHSVYGKISPIFRRKRFDLFFEKLRPDAEKDVILDVGGVMGTWTVAPPCAKRLELLNIYPLPIEAKEAERYGATAVVGDACCLENEDDAFDIVFSNSVIEHVGTWENQKKFAAEVRRTGQALWIQTPARSFFIEPHYIAPFIHWFPKRVRRRLARWFTPWGWLVKPSQEQVDARIDEIRLISLAEFVELFPDCEIIKERFLGVFTKSYVAVRTR